MSKSFPSKRASSLAHPRLGVISVYRSCRRLASGLKADTFWGQLVRRLGIALLVIYIVVSFTFFLIRLMPGNAATYMYYQLIRNGAMSPQAALQQVQAYYGVSVKAPLWQQYLQYLGQLARADFGKSILYTGTPVVHIIVNAIPWTVLVVGVALLVSFVLGCAVGTLMAYFRQSRFMQALGFLMTVLNAVPNYVIAVLLLYWLADLNHVFPVGGAYAVGLPAALSAAFIGSVLMHALLPIIAHAVSGVGGWALAMKGSVTTTLGEDHITAAKYRGLLERRILASYVGRNALLPMATSLGLSFGYMFGGSVFIETLFNYPGLGYYLVSAVNGRDYPLMMGCFILITASVVIGNVVTDLTYQRLDPRTKANSGAARVSEGA